MRESPQVSARASRPASERRGGAPFHRPPLTSTRRIAFRLRAFSTRGAGQRLKRSAWPVHLNEAGLASSPLLEARHGAYRLTRHTLARFLPKQKTKNKKTLLLCNKKQNNYLCSKMTVALRAAGRRNAFWCALALSSGQCRLPARATHGSPSRARAPQETTPPSKRYARIRCASTQK